MLTLRRHRGPLVLRLRRATLCAPRVSSCTAQPTLPVGCAASATRTATSLLYVPGAGLYPHCTRPAHAPWAGCDADVIAIPSVQVNTGSTHCRDLLATYDALANDEGQSTFAVLIRLKCDTDPNGCLHVMNAKAVAMSWNSE